MSDDLRERISSALHEYERTGNAGPLFNAANDAIQDSVNKISAVLSEARIKPHPFSALAMLCMATKVLHDAGWSSERIQGTMPMVCATTEIEKGVGRLDN